MTEKKTYSVKLLNYREVKKGAIVSSFNLQLDDFGLTIFDCKYMVSGSNRWINMPAREIKKEGEKSSYIPYIVFTNKSDFEALRDAVINEIDEKHSVPF